MTEVSILHRQAMEAVDQAEAERRVGNHEAYRTFLQEALQYERVAADLVVDALDLEPTRSVLHRSAASLAVDAKRFELALELIERGLNGRPPDEIADELRALRDQVRSVQVARNAESTDTSQARENQIPSDERLRALVTQGLAGDSAATSTLIRVLETEVLASLRMHARNALLDKADAEDALSEVIVALWAILPRIAQPEKVEYPWAYIRTTIRNRAIDIGRQTAKIRGNEQPFDDWQKISGSYFDDAADTTFVDGMAEKWRQSLSPTDMVAAAVFLEAIRRDEPVSSMIRERFPGDTARQLSLEKRLHRARQKGGFIARLADELLRVDETGGR